MQIGIVTDIHGAVESLECALAEFRRRQVDTVVSLGDACDTFSPAGRMDEVAALLHAAGAVGVWGNHDIGLCRDITERVRRETSPDVLAFMVGMQPHLTIADCRFSHVEPWLDAHKVEDLWYFDGPPDTPEKAARTFAAVPERRVFVGHFHGWLVMTPRGLVNWNGATPLVLNPQERSLIVIAPVVSGWCAIFDTDEQTLIPLRCAAGTEASLTD